MKTRVLPGQHWSAADGSARFVFVVWVWALGRWLREGDYCDLTYDGAKAKAERNAAKLVAAE